MRADDVEVSKPMALSRVGSMLGAILEEIGRGPVDPYGRRLLLGTFDCALAETRRLVPETQRRELDHLIPPLGAAAAESDADLRLAYAQLVGWLQGVFTGAQLAGVVEESRMFARAADGPHHPHGHRGPLPAAAGSAAWP